MRKIILFALCLALLAGLACTKQGPKPSAAATEPAASAEQPVETASPEPSPESILEIPIDLPTMEPFDTAATGLPMAYNVYDEVGVNVSEAEMFRCDIDFDGKEEVISFRRNEENNTTTILIDDREVLFDFSSELEKVVLIDLDPETPWINILVEIDWGSDDEVTTEVHLENGKPVKGVETGGIGITEDGSVIVYGETDFLGTKSFASVATGEKLTVNAEWYDLRYPTEDEIREEFDSLVEWGDLLHTTREVPCTIGGKPAMLAKGSYIYPVRINPSDMLCEVCTLDGITAVISFTLDEDGWPYLIDGIPQDDYFEYILYAD